MDLFGLFLEECQRLIPRQLMPNWCSSTAWGATLHHHKAGEPKNHCSPGASAPEQDGSCHEQHSAIAAASWLLPCAFPALPTPAAPVLAGLQPRALGSSQCWPQLPTLPVPTGHGTAWAVARATRSPPGEHCCGSSWSALVCASTASLRNIT